MKTKYLLLIAGAALGLAGCATNQGGTGEDYSQTSGNTNQAWSALYPVPASSPTFRPGLNPQDPRAPQYLTRPQPNVSPPPTPN